MRIGFTDDGNVGTIVRTAWATRSHDGVTVQSRESKGGGGVTVAPIIPALVAVLPDLFPEDDGNATADRAAGMASSLAETLASVESGVGTILPTMVTLRVREGRDDKGEPTWSYVVGRGNARGCTLTLDGADVISSALRAFAYAAHVGA